MKSAWQNENHAPTRTRPRADVRTTISLAGVIWQTARELMESRGFNKNFSAFVADLIRRGQGTRGHPVPSCTDLGEPSEAVGW